MSKAKPTYEALNEELNNLLLELQREDIDVDLALKHYERGLELVKQLESHLKSAENRIEELRAQFDTAA